MKAEAIKAFVLHTRPYSDASLLVELFTFERGKLTVIAKGVKNKKPQRRQLLQPFRLVTVDFQGRSSLKTLTGVEALSADAGLQREFLYSGLYLNELLLYLLPVEEPIQELFNQYAVTINNLASSDNLEPVLRRFELALLSASGFAPDFTCESQTGAAIVPEKYYRFSPGEGFIPRDSMAAFSANDLPGCDLLAIAADEFTESALKTAKMINRVALSVLLNGRPLKSREFFKQMMA